MSVAAVIFDWGGTLTPWHTVDVRAQWAQTYAVHVHPDDEIAADRLTDALCAADALHWQHAREEQRSATIDQVIAHACAEVGLDPGVVDDHRARTAYEAFWEPHTWIDPQVRPLWEALRARDIRVGVLSNTIWSRAYHRGLFERDGVLDLIDGDAYSSEIPWTKPHPEAFNAAAAAVGCETEQCVYVGDRLYEDVHGPQQVGMRTIWVPHSDIPPEQTVQVDVRPDAVVQSLAEVAGVVHGWQAGP